MSWFNFYGLAIMILLMIPNIILSLRHKEAFVNQFSCKQLEIAEQIGNICFFRCNVMEHSAHFVFPSI